MSLVRSQLVSLEFFIGIKSFRSHYGPGVDSASNRNEYQEYFLGVRLLTLPPSCAVVTKSGNLNFLEPSGPLQACNGTALTLYLDANISETNLLVITFPRSVESELGMCLQQRIQMILWYIVRCMYCAAWRLATQSVCFQGATQREGKVRTTKPGSSSKHKSVTWSDSWGRTICEQMFLY